MTTEQRKIYNAIKNHNVISSEELCEELGIDIDVDSQKRNLSRKSLDLYKEIEKINADPIIQKPILWDTESNYWLARSQEDVENFVNRIYRKSALKKLAKMWNLLRKGERNGQYDLMTDIEEKPYARRFVESFVSELEIIREIDNLKRENCEIEFDDNKYINGNYEKQQKNRQRITDLERWLKERNV